MTRHVFIRSQKPGKKWQRAAAAAVGGLLVLFVGIGIRSFWSAEPAAAQSRQAPAPGKSAPRRPDTSPGAVMATVNGEDILREELGRECLRHYGKEVLASLINRHLISAECQRQGISVSQAEVDAEVLRISQRFGVPKDQWLKLLKDERGLNPAQYGSDVIWPMLALRKLGGQRLKVSPQELRNEFDSRYGAWVKGQMIVCNQRDKAEQARAEALAQPAEFGEVSKRRSDDPAVASVKGMVQPIRRHVGSPQIQQAAFTMRDGEISPVIQIGNQYVVLRREALMPAAENIQLDEKLRGQLEEMIRERKMRGVAADVFRDLQKGATIQNVFEQPALAREMPGVAAVVNGRSLPTADLVEMCLERHGQQTLEGAINRRVLEQACRRQKVTVTEADLQAEIVKAAGEMLVAKDGRADVEGWLKLVTSRQGVTEEIYKRDVVWPTVALKKLVGEKIEVTAEDLKKGFEANYGERVRCRAIYMSDARRAQQVWDMARRNPTADYFGQLAEKYCVDGNMRALRGEMPPVQRHGGQPAIEEEAFKLRKGELSGIIAVGPQQFVILFCEGRTEPKQVDFAAVRELIYQDIHEKKQRVAMGELFRRLQDEATIDNYLAKTSHTPKRRAAAADAAGKGAAEAQAPRPGTIPDEPSTARAGSNLGPLRR